MKDREQPAEENPSLIDLAYEAEQQADRVRSVAKVAAEALSDSISDHDAKNCFRTIHLMMELVCDHLTQLHWELLDERTDCQAEENRP
jgi:hypothetical protein